jgi:putative CocE/NonD family hydrolase
MFRETHYENGCFTLAVRAAALARTAGRVHNPLSFDLPAALETLPLGKLSEVIANPLVAHILEHDTLDDWWRSEQVDSQGTDLEVPALHIVGWFDVPCRRGTLKGYEETIRLSSAHHEQWLIVGPWSHAIGSRHHPFDGRDFGSEAEFDVAETSIAFYDHYLKGVDNGWERTPRVRLFETGSNLWRCVQGWPPLARDTRLFFTPDGALEAAPTRDGTRHFQYDPLDPVCLSAVDDLGAQATSLEHRRDVLEWQTVPLRDEFAVSGWPRVQLQASTDGDDTDWHLRIADVSPDGRAYVVAEGRMRASYRVSLVNPVPLQPEAVYDFSMELTALTHCFLPGHRVRLTLTSSDFPMYARSLNHFGKYRDQAEPRVASNAVYHGLAHPSHVVLPVVRGSFQPEVHS